MRGYSVVYGVPAWFAIMLIYRMTIGYIGEHPLFVKFLLLSSLVALFAGLCVAYFFASYMFFWKRRKAETFCLFPASFPLRVRTFLLLLWHLLNGVSRGSVVRKWHETT